MSKAWNLDGDRDWFYRFRFMATLRNTRNRAVISCMDQEDEIGHGVPIHFDDKMSERGVCVIPSGPLVMYLTCYRIRFVSSLTLSELGTFPSFTHLDIKANPSWRRNSETG